MRNVVIGASLFVAGVFAAPLVSQDDKSHDAMMQEWMQQNQKGRWHEQLAKSQGTWEVETRMWMPGSTEPMTSGGKTKTKMVLDGRFRQEKVDGDMGGQPFKGLGFTGYDTMKKKWVGVWMDSMSNGIMLSEGEAKKDGTVELMGEMPDPAGGSCKVRMVETWKDDDHKTFVMYMQLPEGEFKHMEMDYTRTGDDAED